MKRTWLLTLLLVACAGATPTVPGPTTAPLATSATQTQLTPLAPVAPTTTPWPTPTPQPTLTPTPSPTPLPPKLVILSVDGLRPDALLQAEVPNITALARRGAFSWQAQTVFPPVTLPGHASMLSGYLPEVHGLTWNDYLPARGLISVPTVFSAARAAGLRTVMVVGKEKLAHLNAPDSVSMYIFATGGDQDVADQALAQIQSGFDLMLVHLPNTDFFGHSTGWLSATYLAQLSRTDEAVGRILTALPAHITVILTADHGGHALVHGSDIPEDMTIPWIIAGPGVLPDHPLTSAISVMDTAATAAHVLGLALAPDISGRPVLEAFGQATRDLLHGQWTEGRAQAPARSEMAAAVLGGLIYVPGGFGGERVFQAYGPQQDAWIDLAPLPTGRHHLMTAASGGRIYVFGGGAAGTWNPTSTVYAYDPALNHWAELGPMPEPRMSGVAVVTGTPERVFIVGGAGGSSALLEYDPSADAWRTLAPLDQPREHLAAVALENEIYALGGRWGGVGELSSVEIYDVDAGAWRAGVPLLQPHAGFGAAVLEGHVFVAGGEIIFAGRETLSAFAAFDPRRQAWSAGPDLLWPIHGVAAAADGSRFYLLGGSSRAGAIENAGRVMIYAP